MNSKSFLGLKQEDFSSFSFMCLISSHNFLIAPSSLHWYSSFFHLHDGIESTCLLFSARISKNSFPSWLLVVESLIDSTLLFWSHILFLTSFYDDGNVTESKKYFQICLHFDVLLPCRSRSRRDRKIMAARMESAESRRLRVVNSHLHSEPSGNLLHTRSMLGQWGISSFFSNAPKNIYFCRYGMCSVLQF